VEPECVSSYQLIARAELWQCIFKPLAAF